MTGRSKLPKWTVLYNILRPDKTWIGTGRTDKSWVGTAWEFFNSKEKAYKRYEELHNDPDYTPSIRPYHNGCDFKHLGAAHQTQLKDEAPTGHWPPLGDKELYHETAKAFIKSLSPKEALALSEKLKLIAYHDPKPFHIRGWDICNRKDKSYDNTDT